MSHVTHADESCDSEHVAPSHKAHTFTLQCVAVCCSVLQCVEVCCSVLQRVVFLCSGFTCFRSMRRLRIRRTHSCCSVLQCVLQCVAVCVAGCCVVLQWLYLFQEHAAPSHTHVQNSSKQNSFCLSSTTCTTLLALLTFLTRLRYGLYCCAYLILQTVLSWLPTRTAMYYHYCAWWQSKPVQSVK